MRCRRRSSLHGSGITAVSRAGKGNANCHEPSFSATRAGTGVSLVSSHGAGDVKITDANSSDLKIQSAGAANIDAAGKAKNVTISSTGAGNIDTSKLTAEKAKVDATGAANVDVFASEQLDVTVSGVGSVTYSGNPKVVNKSISGIGSVNPKN